jgi:NitT/TauT family transport system substrate-binding protein
MTGMAGKALAAVFVLAAALTAPVRAAEISVTQWGTSLYGAPYAVAMEKGFFKEAGVDITGIIGSGGGGTTVRNILASPLPYGEVALSAALAAQRQGLDVVIVNAAIRSAAESTLLTMPDSDIKSLKDLAGKKVAITSPKGVSEMLLLMELQKEGVDPASVTRVASGGYSNSLTLLQQGEVAAAGMIEPLSIIRKAEFRTVARAKDILPAMTTAVGITTREFAEANPGVIKAIIAGRRAGVQAIYADPTAAAEIVGRTFTLDPKVAQEAVANMIGPRYWSEGEINQAELDETVKGLALVGEVQDGVDWSKLIDTAYLPPELQAKP